MDHPIKADHIAQSDHIDITDFAACCPIRDVLQVSYVAYFDATTSEQLSQQHQAEEYIKLWVLRGEGWPTLGQVILGAHVSQTTAHRARKAIQCQWANANKRETALEKK